MIQSFRVREGQSTKTEEPMPAETVTVNLGERSYDIRVTSGDRAGIGPFTRERCQGLQAFVVTDEHVLSHAVAVMDALMAAGLVVHLTVLKAGEAEKTLGNALHVCDQLLEKEADRQTVIVAVGGGVIGDLSGFVAATYARGLPLVMVPTTLLAMVDSSVGGKTGVNHPKAKNLIGAFHQPRGVWIDTEFLHTLPDREYKSGLAEVVKYGVILDPELFAFLEANVPALLTREAGPVRHLISRSCRLKADVVERDEREITGLRAILNYGHTFAHAFETVAGYGTWLHGEAVAAGMMCAARLAARERLVDQELVERQEALLLRLDLPVRPEAWPLDALLEAMRKDKKNRAGKLRFILPRRLGKVELVDAIPEERVAEVLQALLPEPNSP
jgi:3-dehydroquinate synthase